MKKSFGKILIVLLIVALTATCLFACNKDDEETTDEPAQDTPATPDNPSTPSNPSNPSNPDTPTQPTVTMTDSYARARTAFQTDTGLLLPELASVNGYYMSADKEIDIGGSTAENGATADTLAKVNAAIARQITVDPTTNGGYTTWVYTRTIEGTTFDCVVETMFQNEGTGGLVVVRYSGQAQGPEINMTESYKNARTAFATITGYTLPKLENCELLDSSDLRTEQHTTACFDITGTANDMAVIIEALQRQINKAPTYADDDGTSWSVEVELNGKLYVGEIWTMLDAGENEGEAYSYVYVNYNVSEVAESYLTGRQFPCRYGRSSSFVCRGGSR